MAHLANQIVPLCALLVNFQLVLIPMLTMEKSDIDDYLDSYYFQSVFEVFLYQV